MKRLTVGHGATEHRGNVQAGSEPGRRQAENRGRRSIGDLTGAAASVGELSPSHNTCIRLAMKRCSSQTRRKPVFGRVMATAGLSVGMSGAF
jgi:hypothetical protein